MELKLVRSVRRWIDKMTFKVDYGSDQYMFMPYWLKKESNGKYHIVKFDELSDELKVFIKSKYEKDHN